jgi:hypothetical protein
MLLHIWLEEVDGGVGSGHARGVSRVDEEPLPRGDDGVPHLTSQGAGQHFFICGACEASGGGLVTVLEKIYILQG